MLVEEQTGFICNAAHEVLETTCRCCGGSPTAPALEGWLCRPAPGAKILHWPHRHHETKPEEGLGQITWAVQHLAARVHETWRGISTCEIPWLRREEHLELLVKHLINTELAPVFPPAETEVEVLALGRTEVRVHTESLLVTLVLE